MQAVILAAGKGTRLKPLTDNTPKPLLRVGKEVLLEYILRAVEPFVDDITVITGYCEEQVCAYIEKRKNAGSVRCVGQGSLGGTWGALVSAREFIKDEPFLVLNGDDYIEAFDVETLIARAPSCGLQQATMPGYEEILIEKEMVSGWQPRRGDTALSATGMYALTKEVFEFEPVFMNETEAGLPHTLFAHPEYALRAVLTTSWVRVNTHEELAALKVMLAQKDM
ncbi:MAG: sugar phosphate nucleotidyltransferase [Patescibacteria group bacterium]